jgi:hypothetical protein
MRSLRRLQLASALVGCLAGTACLKVPQESASLSAMDATEVTASELQMRVYEAGRRFSWIIESAADTIAKYTDDPEVRRRSLRWKIIAIPLVEEASLRADPVVAVADLWGFSFQLSDYFRTGGGRELFGAEQPLAVAATDSLVRIGAEVAARLRPGGQLMPQDESDLRGWAGRHPIVGSSMGRESVLSSNWKVLSITESSVTGTVASVQRSVSGVTNRLGYVNENMFKRVLWQGQLAAGDMMPAVDSTIAGQRGWLLDAITEQRVATFAGIAAERKAVLSDVAGERQAVLAAVQAERIAVLDAIRAERIATLAAADSMTQRSLELGIAAADSMTQRSIDHAFASAGRLLLWVFVGLVVVAFAGGLGAGIAIRAVRSRPAH